MKKTQKGRVLEGEGAPKVKGVHTFSILLVA